MRRAIELPPRCAPPPRPNPWVGAVVLTPTAPVRGGHRSRPAAPTPRSSPSTAAGDAGPGRHALHHPRALLATRAARRRAPTPSSPPASAGWSSASRTPTRTFAAQGIARLREAGIDVEVGVLADRGRRATGAVPEAPAHRPAVGGAQAGGDARRPHRGARRHESVDHRRRGTGRRPPAAGRERRRARRRRHRPGRRPVAHRAPASTAPTRCASCSARRAPGAKVQPALELEGALPGVLDELGRRGVVQLLVEGGATVAHDFHAARLVDRYVLYLAPALARRRRRPGAVRRTGRRHDRRRVARRDRRRRPSGRRPTRGGG